MKVLPESGICNRLAKGFAVVHFFPSHMLDALKAEAGAQHGECTLFSALVGVVLVDQFLNLLREQS